jgi:hypothetical protein
VEKGMKHDFDDGRRRDEGITSREVGEPVITKRRRNKLDQVFEVNDDSGGGVGLRWFVEYICYGYF